VFFFVKGVRNEPATIGIFIPLYRGLMRFRQVFTGDIFNNSQAGLLSALVDRHIGLEG
jgi:hypothetical protein